MKTAWKIVVLIIVVSLIGIGYFSFKGITGSVVQPGKYGAFAHCLTENGAVFYGSFECPHCNTQKEMFGNSMRYINYVECGPLGGPINKECGEIGIKAYPTWIIDGKKHVGILKVEKLSELTNCPLQ